MDIEAVFYSFWQRLQVINLLLASIWAGLMPLCQLIVLNQAQIGYQIVNIVIGNVLFILNLVDPDSGSM